MFGLLDELTTFRFAVNVDGILFGKFSEFQLPTLTVDTVPVIEGGQNTYTHQLPVRVSTGPVTLKRGVAVSKDLLDWYMDVLQGDMENATRQVTVMVMSPMMIPLFVWNFRNAYPTKWTGPTLKTSENVVLVESLEFVYHGFEVM